MVLLPVRQDRDPGLGDGEIPEQLRGIPQIEGLAHLLALDEDLNLAVLEDRVIDLLAALYPGEPNPDASYSLNRGVRL